MDKRHNGNMKTTRKYIYLAAAIGSMAAMSACSNVEEGFHVADRSNLTLSISPRSTQSEGGSSSTTNLSIIAAVDGKDRVNVNSQANWIVEVVNDGRPADQTEWTLYIDEVVNNGTESYFTFNSTTNTKSQREWPNAFKIYVAGNNGEDLVPQYLTVRQESSVLLPSPTSFEIFPANGSNNNVITVTATRGWSVVSGQEYSEALPDGWISIDRSQQETGKVLFSVMPNRGASVRTGSLQFLDEDGVIVTEINISQSESKDTFDVSISEGGNLIPQAGADLTVNVLSDKGWKVTCDQACEGGWISIDGLGQNQAATTGTAGGAGKQLGLHISASDHEESRVAEIVFSRTEDGATATTEGVADIRIKIMQAGRTVPAVSTPWIEGEFNQKVVNIYARYFFDGNCTGGIEIRNVTEDGEFVSIADMGNEDGLVHIQLTSDGNYDGFTYRAGQEYEMRTYVSSDFSMGWSHSVTFRSPGIKPGNDDLVKPGVN